MLRNLFESTVSAFRAIITMSLLLAATAGAITLAYVIVMACIRVSGSLWRHLFSEPFP